MIMLGKGSRSSSILPRMWGDTFGSRDLESPLHTTPAILTCPCQRGSTTPDLNCRHPRVTQCKRRPLCCKLWLFASPLTERSAVMSQEKYIGMDVHQSNDLGCSRGSPCRPLCDTLPPPQVLTRPNSYSSSKKAGAPQRQRLCSTPSKPGVACSCSGQLLDGYRQQDLRQACGALL